MEALLALLLLSVVVQGAWGVVARARTAAAYVAGQAEALETIRTLGWLLPEEVSGGRPGRDWWVGEGDSLPLRAFRGLAIVLDPGGPEDRIRVCYRGVRSPNPGKDSILVLGKEGRWAPHGLSDRSRVESSCFGIEGGWEEEWALSPPTEGPVLGRLFERGSYHLTNRALRYKRGAGGRQPLTPERIDEGRFLGFAGGDGAYAWEVLLLERSGHSDSLPWRGRLR